MKLKKTFTTKTVNPSEIEERWFLLDAKGKRIGRIATTAAELLLQKDVPHNRNYLMPKTKVVIINADEVDVTENRKISKVFTRYSGYPSGLTKETLGEVMERRPLKALRHAVRGMLPKGRRGRAINAKNVYIYVGAEHDHSAQKPKTVEIN